MSDPVCGAQQPGTIPSPFDWWPFVAAGAVAAALGYVYASGVPGVNGILGALGYAPLGTAFGPAMITGAAAGAAAIVVLVLYYALQPDGCIRSLPKGQAVCFSGIVEEVSDTSSTAVDVLAPFAIPPAGIFNVVVKSMYWHLVTQNAFWVFCTASGSAMLPCIVKDESACGGKIGSLIGAGAGAVAGIVAGYVGAAAVAGAVGCAASGPFYLLCLLLVILVAAIVAAAVTYAGAMVGGWIGEGIGSIGEDPVGDAWKSLERGAIVTVQGNWVTNSDIGNNEIYYVTQLGRTGQADPRPSYTTTDADATAADDCPVVIDPIR
jgi:hypothetical protein